MWTRFYDMHSGGGCKLEPWEVIFIEAPEEAARDYFLSRFGRDPNHVTCDCCGEDYSVSTAESLEQATGHGRRCLWVGDRYEDCRGCEPLAEYLQQPHLLVVRVEEVAAASGG